MLFYTVGQSYVFLAALMAGLAIGAWYDILKCVRRLLEAGPVLSLLADLAFGLGAGAIAIYACYIAAYGELRLYSVMGMVSGAAVYFGTVSRAIGWLAPRAMRIAGRALGKIARCRAFK